VIVAGFTLKQFLVFTEMGVSPVGIFGGELVARI